jgi:GDPmannose 4,6-dehydratase
VTHGAARIKLGLANELRLGNLDSRRDWGYAGDYVEAMWLMLQQENPDNYVVGTGKTYSVRVLCKAAFGYLNLDWQEFVVQDPKFYRPAEVDLLVSDPSKARQALGWEPTVSFDELIHMMVDADLKALKKTHRGGAL